MVGGCATVDVDLFEPDVVADVVGGEVYVEETLMVVVGLDFAYTDGFECVADGVGGIEALGRVDEFGSIGFDHGTEAETVLGVAYSVAEGEKEVGVKVVLGEVGGSLTVDTEFGGRPRTNFYSGKGVKSHAPEEGVAVECGIEPQPR